MGRYKPLFEKDKDLIKQWKKEIDKYFKVGMSKREVEKSVIHTMAMDYDVSPISITMANEWEDLYSYIKKHK